MLFVFNIITTILFIFFAAYVNPPLTHGQTSGTCSVRTTSGGASECYCDCPSGLSPTQNSCNSGNIFCNGTCICGTVTNPTPTPTCGGLNQVCCSSNMGMGGVQACQNNLICTNQVCIVPAEGTACNPQANIRQCPSNMVCQRTGSDPTEGICVLPENATNISINEFELCENATDSETQAICEDCLLNGRIYTALGCLPTSPRDFVESFLRLASGFAGGFALLRLMWGAFSLTTSAGDPKRIQAAQETVTSSIAGLLFIIFAVILLQLIGAEILQLPGL